MIRTILNDLYARNLDYAHRLTAELDEAQTLIVPSPGMNHPRWIIGHLAQTADQVSAGWLLQLPRSLESYDKLFDFGTTATSEPAGYPLMAALQEALGRQHERVSEAVRQLHPADFERALPITLKETFRQRFPTLGHALLHTMVGHEMLHLGQLSAWRRARGLPTV